MHAGFLAILAVQAASAVLATPTATDPTLDQLSDLAQSAYDQAQTELDDDAVSKRGGSCSLSNVRIRREWFVRSRPLGAS